MEGPYIVIGVITFIIAFLFLLSATKNPVAAFIGALIAAVLVPLIGGFLIAFAIIAMLILVATKNI